MSQEGNTNLNRNKMSRHVHEDGSARRRLTFSGVCWMQANTDLSRNAEPGQVIGEVVTLSTADRNGKWYNRFGKEFGHFSLS